MQSWIDIFCKNFNQRCKHSVNSYVKSFKTAVEVGVEQSDIKLVLHADKKPPQGGHVRTYNLPASSEVAALLPGDATGNLDIILRCIAGDGQELRRISTCHRLYVLLFSTGCDGWHLGLKKTDHKTLIAAESLLQIRNNDSNIMFRVEKLTQQYAVDQWAKIEAGRVDWVRRNQKS